MNIDIIAIGRMKNTAHIELFHDYLRRMDWSVNVKEIESKHTDQTKMHEDECALLLKNLSSNATIIAMDERGKTLPSREFAQKFQNWQNEGLSHVQFFIGGADGLNDEIRKRAQLLLSFGKQTWPHMLARIMLLEQIYRAQQILKNHPYHRD